MRKYTLNEDFFENIDSEEKAYLLGFIQADGCVNDESLIIGLAARDEGHLYKIRNILEANVPIRTYDRIVNGKVFPRSEIRIYKGKIRKNLNALGILPRKSMTSQPIQIDEELQQHYIRGLVDGDGWITGSGSQTAIGLTGCRPIVNYFAQFARQICGTRSLPYPNHSIWSFRVTGNAMPKKLIEKLYSGAKVALERKQLLANEIILGGLMVRSGEI
jgi:hypothetical protein